VAIVEYRMSLHHLPNGHEPKAKQVDQSKIKHPTTADEYQQTEQNMEIPIKMFVVQFASTELALATVDRLEAAGLPVAGVSCRRRSCSIRFEFTNTNSVSKTLATLQVVLGLYQRQDDGQKSPVEILSKID